MISASTETGSNANKPIKKTLFELGTIVMTAGIQDLIGNDVAKQCYVQGCLARHANGDWGDVDEESVQMNNDSVDAEKDGKYIENIMSVYNWNGIEIWIITECDRSATTILLPEEY